MFCGGMLGALTPIQVKTMEALARRANELHGLMSFELPGINSEAQSLDDVCRPSANAARRKAHDYRAVRTS